MEACYGGTDVMERSCAVARGIDINRICMWAKKNFLRFFFIPGPFQGGHFFGGNNLFQRT